MNVSIATIPPRFLDGSLKQSIQGFLNQTEPIKKIYINLPINFKRFDNLTIEDEKEIESYSNKIIITKTDYDSPLLKWVGALKHIDDDEYIFIGDDDQVYKKDLLKNMKNGFYDDEAVFQNRFHVVKKGTAGIIHGFVGIMIKKKVMNNIDKFNIPQICWIDDQLMSIYFFKNNIKILPSPIHDYDDIYEVLNNHDMEQIGKGALCKMDLPRIKQITELEILYNVFFQNKNSSRGKGKIINIEWKKFLNEPININFVCLDKPTVENKQNIKNIIKLYPNCNINLWDFEEYKKIYDTELKTTTLLNYYTDLIGINKCNQKGYNIYINRNFHISNDFNIYNYILNDTKKIYNNDMLEIYINFL